MRIDVERGVCVAALAAGIGALGGVSGVAMAQLPAPTPLGELSETPTATQFVVFQQVAGGAADVFVVDGTGCGSDANDRVFGTFLAQEGLFSFTLTEASRVSVLTPDGASNPDNTLLGSHFFILTGTTDDVATAQTADGEFSAACLGEARLNRFGEFADVLQAGDYLLAVDVYTGPPSESNPGFAGGFVQFRLAADPVVSDPDEEPTLDCGADQTSFAADAVLPIDIAGGVTRATVSASAGDFAQSRLCAFRKGAGGVFAGLVSPGPEIIYGLTLSEQATVSIENNRLSVTPAENPDFYLVQADGASALAAQTPVDIFGDGTLRGTVALNAVTFLEDAGTFGTVEAGEYFLVVDSLPGNEDRITGDGELNFDVDLVVETIAACGVTSPAVDAVIATEAVAGGTLTVTFNDPDPTAPSAEIGGNEICAYRTAEGIPPNAFGLIESFPEYVAVFSTGDPTPGVDDRISATLRVITGDEPGDADLDFYIVEAPGGTLPGNTVVEGFPGYTGVSFNTSAVAFAPFGVEDGTPFGLESRGIAEAVLDEATTYALVVEGLRDDRDQSFSVELSFEESSVPAATFSPADVPPAAALGEIGIEGEFLGIFLCGSPGQNTAIAVWDAATGELVARDDDGCGTTFGPSLLLFPADSDNALPRGEYVLAVAGGDAVFQDDFVADVLGSTLAVSGILDIGSVEAPETQVNAPFSAADRDRALFSFSVGAPAGGCSAADFAEPFDVLNSADVTAFVTAFQTGDERADTAEPFGVLNSADVTTFVGAFQAGCP